MTLLIFSLRLKTFKFDATLLFKDDVSIRNFSLDTSGLYLYINETSNTPLKDHHIGIYELFTGEIVRKLTHPSLSTVHATALSLYFDARYLLASPMNGNLALFKCDEEIQQAVGEIQEKGNRQWWLQYQCELNPSQYVSDENARRIAQVNKKVGVRSP
jgi:hypothetical protein